MKNINPYYINKEDIKKDINIIFWSIKLHFIKRYIHQKYWTEETRDSLYADKIEAKPKLESVSEHSWHVADMALLLAPHFPFLNLSKCIQLAIIHDKMEIYAGDPSPVGRDGTGEKAHAFNKQHQYEKDKKEFLAISRYINLLREDIQVMQKSLLDEIMQCESLEARFIKAIDKLQATIYILVKKKGKIEDKHLCFLEKFNNKNINYFPPLKGHYDFVSEIIYTKVATHRKTSKKKLKLYIKNKCMVKNLFSSNLSNDFQLIKPITKNSKNDRLNKLFIELENLPIAKNSLEAFRQISETLNIIEDSIFGLEHWKPLRFYPPLVETKRMYPVAPESIYSVHNFSKVMLMVSINQLVFISNDGAMEFQIKDKEDIFGVNINFSERQDKILYSKNDIYGCNVWDKKNH